MKLSVMFDTWMDPLPQEYVDGLRENFSTPNGVVYTEYYVYEGCKFHLVDEGQSDEEFAEAAAWLRAGRDVVGQIRKVPVEQAVPA